MTNSDLNKAFDGKFSPFQIDECIKRIQILASHISNLVDTPVRDALGVRPAELEVYFNKSKNAVKDFTSTGVSNYRDLFEHLPLLKAALVHSRKYEAINYETKAGQTTNQALATQLRHSLDSVESLIAGSWFDRVEPTQTPKLTDFLNIQQAESAILQDWLENEPTAELDQKFGILKSPSSIFSDLHRARYRSALRETAITVAFIDIDDFGDFNKTYTEPVVDRLVLPRFMMALEVHVFGRGAAYRHGGDEFIVISPNLTWVEASNFFSDFQTKLSELDVPGISERISVSIGLCNVVPHCALTDTEIVELASFAKKSVKDSGKAHIAGYPGPNYVRTVLETVILPKA